MSLRTQLLFVSLLTLALPWAGCQYVKEMEAVLREGHTGALMATARAVSHVLAAESGTLYRDPKLQSQFGDTDLDVYAHAMSEAVNVDGFDDEWHALSNDWVGLPMRSAKDPYPELSEKAGQARYLAGVRDGFLYLFISADLSEPVDFHNPTLRGIANGEHVILHLGDAGQGARRYWLRTAAPGAFSAVRLERHAGRQRIRAERRIQANWQSRPGGFQIELRVPVGMLGAEFGFSIVDMQRTTQRASAANAWFGTVPPDLHADTGALGYLIHPSVELARLLSSFQQPGMRIRVIDGAGRLLGENGSLLSGKVNPDAESGWTPRLQDLYRAIVETLPSDELSYLQQQGQLRGTLIEKTLAGEAQSVWRRQPGSELAVIATAHPIQSNGQTLGAVLLEQSSDSVLAVGKDAITGLFNTTLLVILIAASGLLGFATLLSVRIRKLRDAAEHSVTPDGRITSMLTPARSRDELGDLSRSFSGLLKRLEEYNQYLQTLASKLSHELRTPLAVVNSSLENLDQEELSEQARICSHRARDGAARLRSILAALSEATRVEQSTRAAEPEIFDLRNVVEGSVQGYREVYAGHFFDLDLAAGQCMMLGSPDLIAQMLDKLIENAADFCPPGGSIRVALRQEDNQFLLSVANDGPPLPRQMQTQLFDQLVSVRESRGSDSHLGLGLHIVKLVVEHHGGRVRADNLPGDIGVEFTVELPQGM